MRKETAKRKARPVVRSGCGGCSLFSMALTDCLRRQRPCFQLARLGCRYAMSTEGGHKISESFFLFWSLQNLPGYAFFSRSQLLADLIILSSASI